MVPFSFAGHDFLASPDGALHWLAEGALLVADLHLEKASWFARLGQFLPPYDSHATLVALERDIQGLALRRHESSEGWTEIRAAVSRALSDFRQWARRPD